MKKIFAISCNFRAADILNIIFEPTSLVFTEGKSYFLSSPQGRDGSKLPSIEDKSEAPGWVQREKESLENVLFGPISSIGESNLVPDRYGKLGGETKFASGFPVDKMVQGDPAKTFSFPSNLGNVVSSISAFLKSFVKSLCLFFRRFELAFDSYFHLEQFYHIREKCQGVQLLPRPYGGSLRRIMPR